MKRITAACAVVLAASAAVSWSNVAMVVLRPGLESRLAWAAVLVGLLAAAAAVLTVTGVSAGRIAMVIAGLSAASLLFAASLWNAVGLLSLLGVAVTLVMMAVRSWRPGAVRALAVFVALFAGIWIGTRLGWRIWMGRLREVPVQGSELVRAIKAHERDKGTPPARIADLVPRYMAAIPPTGVPDDWHYETGPFTGPADVYGYGDNPWVLNVYTGRHGVGFQKAMYFPNGMYAARRGPVQKVGDWAIVGY